MAMQTLALFLLVTLAVGGLAWVFIYPIMSGERHAEQRQERVVRTEPVVRAANSRNTPKVRREQVGEEGPRAGHFGQHVVAVQLADCRQTAPDAVPAGHVLARLRPPEHPGDCS